MRTFLESRRGMATCPLSGKRFGMLLASIGRTGDSMGSLPVSLFRPELLVRLQTGHARCFLDFQLDAFSLLSFAEQAVAKR